MAGDWIKMRTNLDTDPAVVRISSGLKMDRFAIVGRLHRVWAWANEHLTDGNDVPIDSAFLDSLVECPGFAEAMRRVGWLAGRDGFLCFPRFERHNGASAKSRAMDALRKRNVRQMSVSEPDKNRTREEKSREEKNIKHKHESEVMKTTLLQDAAFAEIWNRWKRHRVEKFKPVGDIEEEQQLYELSKFTIDEAIEVVGFSIERGALGLIKNGDHKQPQRASKKKNTILDFIK